MADNRREKDKRFFFTRGQLFLLGGSFTATAAIVFFLGIVVGKDLEARRSGKTDEAVTKFPVKQGTTAAEAAHPLPAEELTYYDTSAKAPPADPPGDEKRSE